MVINLLLSCKHLKCIIIQVLKNFNTFLVSDNSNLETPLHNLKTMAYLTFFHTRTLHICHALVYIFTLSSPLCSHKDLRIYEMTNVGPAKNLSCHDDICMKSETWQIPTGKQERNTPVKEAQKNSSNISWIKCKPTTNYWSDRDAAHDRQAGERINVNAFYF